MSDSAINMDDLNLIFDEVENAYYYKARTIDNIENERTRDIITTTSNSIDWDSIASAAEGAVNTASDIKNGIKGAAAGMAVAGVGGSILASSGVGLAVAGAAIGSTVPIIGTIIGAGVGGAMGIFANKKKNDKMAQARMGVYREIEERNEKIEKLNNEIVGLENTYEGDVINNKRYRYLLSLLAVVDGLQKSV